MAKEARRMLTNQVLVSGLVCGGRYAAFVLQCLTEDSVSPPNKECEAHPSMAKFTWAWVWVSSPESQVTCPELGLGS